MELKMSVVGTADVLKNISIWKSIKFREKIRDALNIARLKIEDDARRMAPVDTGALRAGMWSKMVDDSTAEIGDGVFYGCIFGAHNAVHCGRGKQKSIGQIKKGDKVMAQDGKLHKVIATFRYLAIEKPYLVELIYPYRKDRNHKLTLTRDHKVLVNRKGCNHWIEAGKLRGGDIVYTLYKKNFNNAKKERVKKECLFCGKTFKILKSTLKYRNGKFCCDKCRIDSRKTKLNPHWGMKRSKKTRKLLSKKALKREELYPEKNINRRLAKKGFKTSHEKEIETFLKRNHVGFELQRRIGMHFVDFYLKTLKLIIEADGAFWHKSQKKDIKRDKEILALIPRDWIIIHIHFTDKRFSKRIKFNPARRVYYMQCNSSMQSFVNPKRFQCVKIKKVRLFKYENRSKNKGCKGKKLYDLAVEDIHSFVVRGLVVSNSFQEFGTTRHPAQPFLRPAFLANVTELENQLKEMLR